VSGFKEALEAIAKKVPETRVLMIMGSDGIPIEKLVVQPDPNLEMVTAEYTTLLRSSLVTARETGVGELRELAVLTEHMTVLLENIASDYYLFACLAPGGILGRARFALKVAGVSLEREFV
jgi:predicted regulator of Ras-like GTPase activity (Roadblock/LC7/MglB family)